jgi:hypothetical protein
MPASRARLELPCRLELLTSEVLKYLKYEILKVQESLFVDWRSQHSGPICVLICRKPRLNAM